MEHVLPKATSCHFRAGVLTITPPSLPDAITLSLFTCLCGSLPERSVQTVTTLSLLNGLHLHRLIFTITYRQCTYVHIELHGVGSTTVQRMPCTESWSWKPVSRGVIKMGNIAPRAGFEPNTSCYARISVLTNMLPRLPDAITLPVYETSSFTGQ